MWIIGVMSELEMALLKQGGYDVKRVDELAFNKLIEPESNFAESCREIVEGDVLVATFTEADMFEELNKCIMANKAEAAAKKREMLRYNREFAADVEFGKADKILLDIPDESEVVDNESWEDNGDDSLIKKFYFSNPDGGDSLIGSFIVDFKKNSTKIIDSHSNTH